ncbi:MAG: PilZ domain-containing protein [Terriglobales bacterium]
MAESRTGKRFPLQLPITIRGGKRPKVAPATTANVSAAGVYISADTELEIGSKIRFAIKLPGSMVGSRKDVEIECRGRVVRMEDAAGARAAKGKKKSRGKKRGVACVIDHYRFRRNS